MFIIDQKLQQHFTEDRDSFMMRMITNVNQLMKQNFDWQEEKTDVKNQIMSQMMTIILEFKQKEDKIKEIEEKEKQAENPYILKRDITIKDYPNYQSVD